MAQAGDSGTKGFSVSAFGKTDVGKKRKNNQDSIFLSSDNRFFILADGMGGHQGGEEASRLATETVSAVFNAPDGPRQLGETDEASLKDIPDAISRMTRAAILEADLAVVRKGEENRELEGLGSTLETLVIDEGAATIGHVGDSRVYRLRAGALERVTEDHSVLAEELKRRKMTPKEIKDFPFRNRITRALGHLDDRRVDIHKYGLEKHDLFLMCSDGLTDVAGDEEIESILRETKGDLKGACEKLVQTALDGGGPDNVSVIVVLVG
ncbi:Protein serine/threonine phosphatase PrpC, regulation of stationary phase [hydrothermal vent metagenome]|uniref:Protein serine/threonine phosphatase PrpC, regulation of stationary phase n=1 Tax=hydrothermal vent metagenome TaxID=652676 RepID=A0A3B1CNK1_9ZZZZ